MSFRTQFVLLASLVWLIPTLTPSKYLLAAPGGDEPVKLTILYTGDEYGYLEPCG
jgi:hypothetical protein